MKLQLALPIFALLLANITAPVFAQAEPTPAYGILMDNSGSLRTQLPQIKSVARELVSRVHQRGPVSVFTFATQGEVLVPVSDAEWTQDRATLDRFIDTVAVRAGRTTLIDSINSIAQRLDLKAETSTHPVSEKILILLTDGEDRQSQISQEQLINDLKKSGYKVYAVGLVQELDDEAIYFDAQNPRRVVEKDRPKKMAIQLLSEITRGTGGRVIFPKHKFKVDAVLKELLAQ